MSFSHLCMSRGTSISRRSAIRLGRYACEAHQPYILNAVIPWLQAAEMAPTAHQAEELARLMEECDKFGRRIEMEHQKIEELNGILTCE